MHAARLILMLLLLLLPAHYYHSWHSRTVQSS
jgi:hypothetical protein